MANNEPAGGAGPPDPIDRTPYIILGHGEEIVDPSRRDRVPENSILVVSEECGVEGTLPDSIYLALSNPANEELFKHPIGREANLQAVFGKSVRVYGPKTSCPVFKYELFNTDEIDKKRKPGDAREVNLYLSGVHKLPLPPGVIEMSPGKPYPASLKAKTYDQGVPGELMKRAFTGSLVPSQEVIHGIVEKRRADLLESGGPLDDTTFFVRKEEITRLLKVSQSTLFKKGGIFYMFLCRGISGLAGNVEGVLSNAFPESALKPFENDGAGFPYNVPGGIMDWIASRRRANPGKRQLRALAEAEALVTPVLLRRRASRTAFHLGVENSNSQRLLRLLGLTRRNRRRMGANINSLLVSANLTATEPQTGYTALLKAAEDGDIPLLLKILSKGVDINQKSIDRSTALLLASEARQEDAALKLLEVGADPFIVREDGVSVLHTAAEGNQVRLLRKLLSRGLDPRLRDIHGETPLHHAANGDAPGTAKVLLEKDKGLTRYLNTEGYLPIHLACRYHCPRVLRVLAKAGPGVNTPTPNGESCLALALKGYDPDDEDDKTEVPEIFKLLLRLGATPREPRLVLEALEQEYDHLAAWFFKNGIKHIPMESLELYLALPERYPEFTKAFAKYQKNLEGGRRRTIRRHRGGRKTRRRYH
jgi:hypothetical protein